MIVALPKIARLFYSLPPLTSLKRNVPKYPRRVSFLISPALSENSHSYEPSTFKRRSLPLLLLMLTSKQFPLKSSPGRVIVRVLQSEYRQVPKALPYMVKGRIIPLLKQTRLDVLLRKPRISRQRKQKIYSIHRNKISYASSTTCRPPPFPYVIK